MKNVNCTAVFLIENKNILLAMKKRGYGMGKWNGAGGKIKPGESITQAMIRECQEELGVSPVEFTAAARLEFINQRKEGTIVANVFVCSAWNGEPVETEEMAPRWFKVSDIPYDEMWEDDRYWLPQVLDGKFIQGRFSFDDQQKMLNYTLEEL